MKFLFLLLLGALAAPAPQSFAEGRELLYDGLESIERMKREVWNVVEVNRTPLFDNAPCLRLRPGDKLVKAMSDLGGKGGRPPRFHFHVFSEGRYYQIWADEEDGKLLLSAAFYSAENCLLFDWDMTPENAKALRTLLPNKYASSLTIKQFEAVLAAVKQKFPGIKIDYESGHPSLSKDRVISISSHTYAEFQGLAYDSFRNRIYKYTIKIGPTVFSIDGQTLLQGPGHVDRSEFERVETRGPNGPAFQPDIDPITAKLKKAEFDEMIRFQNLVIEIIQSKAITPK